MPTANEDALGGKERRRLRAAAQHLEARVQIGKGGLTSGSLRALEAAFADTDLVKIRVGRTVPDVETLLRRTEKALGARVVQRIGHVALFYRPRPVT